MHHINVSRVTNVIHNWQTLVIVNMFVMIILKDRWENFHKWVKKIIIKVSLPFAQHLSASKYENIEISDASVYCKRISHR